MILNTTNPATKDRSELYAWPDPKYLPAGLGPVYSWPAFPSYAGLESGPFGYGLDQLIHQKQELILSRIHLLHSEIYHRYELKNQNLYQINLDQCTCRNLILLLGENSLDKRRIQLERKIIDLEQEKRKERTGYFRDILFLRKELRETLIEKLEEEQKASLFVGQEEEFK